MPQSDMFRENAERCLHLAENADNEAAFNRYKRMEAAWLALAYEQDWLDGELSAGKNVVHDSLAPPSTADERTG